MSNSNMTIDVPFQQAAIAVGHVRSRPGSSPAPSPQQPLGGTGKRIPPPVAAGRSPRKPPPLNATRNFERQLVRRAVELLESHPHFHGRSSSVHCRCGDGTLELQGAVPTYHLKQMAQEAVRKLGNDRQIVNHIRVIGLEGFRDSCPESETKSLGQIRKPR